MPRHPPRLRTWVATTELDSCDQRLESLRLPKNWSKDFRALGPYWNVSTRRA